MLCTAAFLAGDTLLFALSFEMMLAALFITEML
jgi:hypothetical protein